MCISLIVLMMTFATQVISGDYKSERRNLENFVAKKDYLLEKDTLWGWDKIGFIFGYLSDREGCNSLKSGMEIQFPAAQYRCVPANSK